MSSSLTVTETPESVLLEISVESVVIEITSGGPKGNPGIDGLSAYQVAVNNGFVGTEAAWLASLQGINGIQGIQGIQGIPGDAGAPGITLVHHGIDPNVARPVGAVVAYWLGTANPVNAAVYDFWLEENV